MATVTNNAGTILRPTRGPPHHNPVSGSIALLAATMPAPFHTDPMDRIIVAAALFNHAQLITVDQTILASKACKLLWQSVEMQVIDFAAIIKR